MVDATPIGLGRRPAAVARLSWSITPFERTVLEAVAASHRQTGAPVMVHLEHGGAAWDVLEVLADLGVAANRVAQGPHRPQS